VLFAKHAHGDFDLPCRSSKAKCIPVARNKVSDRASQETGLILKAVPTELPTNEVGFGAARMISGPVNQLAIPKNSH
jgi:hypothetical protein